MKKLLDIALRAAIKASEEIHEIYNQGFDVSLKDDDSPVTTGDLKANEIITSYLSQTDYPILSEESEKLSAEIRNSWKQYWCIDPIDGTKEYVKKTGEYCVSIGMLTPETSLLGVLAAPSMGLFYFAAKDLGSFKWKGKYSDLYILLDKENILEELIRKSEKLGTHKRDKNEYIFLTSLSHYNEVDEEYYQKLKKTYPEIVKKQMGSAIKIGLVAEGKAHEYARLTPVNFWDVAGGHAVAKYAGLDLIDYQTGEKVNYYNISEMKISGYIVRNI